MDDIIVLQRLNNVGMDRETINYNFSLLKHLINTIQLGLIWIEHVENIIDALHATPANGNRYIASQTSDGWIINNIYEYVTGTGWEETVAVSGMSTWIDSLQYYVTFNGTEWVRLGNVIAHNTLDGLNSGDFQHLTLAQLTALVGGGDAGGLHKHDLQVAVPVSFPTAPGVRNQWAVDLVEKLFYYCISLNTWVRWTIETNL